MSRIRYSKYIPQPLDDIDLEDLLDQLKDFFLESGFYSQFNPFAPSSQSLENLYQALAQILAQNEQLPREWRDELEQYAENFPESALSEELQELLDQLIQRLMAEDYIHPSQQDWNQPSEPGQGSESDPVGNVQFELTDRGLDFLGYKTLRELMSSVGRNSLGRHDTHHLSTGVLSDSHSRPYEFGDTLNLDMSATLLNAVKREGLEMPLQLEYKDLMVYQTDHQSSCATVLMLDCSHSMILYGTDRFTPAKKVALALAHLIRSQFPGDSLHVVLFHDSSEEIPLSKLASVKVGPYHTNTCEGLRVARRILLHQKKDMRQIIMITDGKPSAITLPSGRIYRNPFGLDPMILQETFREVANCRKANILINTFMLAKDYYLVDFVKKVSQICRGKAYFTTTVDLASSIMMDFMTKKTRTVH
ncbi:MAG: VWA domain-containing protein [Acidobacteriota bacterium]